MRIIFIELAGGLGNQVFQLAAAKQFAQASHATVIAFRAPRFERSAHDTSALRLPQFDDIKERSFNGIVRLVISVGFRLRRAAPWLPLPIVDFLWPKDLGFSQVSIRKSITFLRGYFQASTYVASLASRNASPLIFDGPAEFSESNNQLAPIFVHVRGGDYKLARNPQGLLPATYYLDAINLADQVLGELRPIWVFTDDEDRALEVLKGFEGRFTFVERLFSLDTMSSFKAFAQGQTIITANSTFSVSSALLGSPNLVIAPEPPFQDLASPTGFYNERFHLVRCAWGPTGQSWVRLQE